jgi:predicted RNA binding protein YcfA (HicA-like mRNA interferase family)
VASRLLRITAAELLRGLRRHGWYRDHQTGSHQLLRHPSRRGTVVVPVHAGRIIKPKTLQTILDQAGLSPEDLRRLL